MATSKIRLIMRSTLLIFAFLFASQFAAAQEACSGIFNVRQRIGQTATDGANIVKQAVANMLLVPEIRSSFWLQRGAVEVNLSPAAFNKSQKTPVVIWGKKDGDEKTLVLYKNHIFIGNYTKWNVRRLGSNDLIDLTEVQRRQPAVEILPDGSFQVVENASRRLLDLYMEDQGHVLRLYRGTSEFEFQVMSLLQKISSKPPEETASAADIRQIRSLAEAWATDPRYENNYYLDFPLWTEIITAFEHSPPSNREFVDRVINNFMRQTSQNDRDISVRIYQHKLATFATPNLGVASAWAFDRSSKYQNGRVLAFDLDLNQIRRQDEKMIYVGIEGDALEVGFYELPAKRLLLSGLSSQTLSKDQDQRPNALWKKNKDAWDYELSLPREPHDLWEYHDPQIPYQNIEQNNQHRLELQP